MYARIGEVPAVLDAEITAKLERLSFPTLGHYLEEGFAETTLRRLVGTTRVIGTAFTVRTTATDSTMLHHGVGHLEPGHVLVVDTGGDMRHAPLGEVVAAQAQIRGAAGAIVDGCVTDTEEIGRTGFPVWAKATSMLTTKLHAIDAGGVNFPVTCGGVTVNPGDVVLADANGVLFVPREILEPLIDVTLEDDAAEPALVQKLRDGARLGDETGASEMVRTMLASTEY